MLGLETLGSGDVFTLSATLLSVATVSQNHFRNRLPSFLNVVKLFFLSAACIGSFSQKPAALVSRSILLT